MTAEPLMMHEGNATMSEEEEEDESESEAQP